jgi:tetratricopeptide (TPR) repeat protein
MEIGENQENTYRYPGLRPFSDTDHDRRLFFGRDEEIQYILHSILVENLFVLFARSGMGKTSLLHAGLMELLRRNNFLPLVIRFNERDRAPLVAIYPGIEKAIARRNETVDKSSKIDFESGETDTLWQFFKTAAFWTAEDKHLTPVLIFDQFEEFFTIHTLESREAFIEQLADLVRGRVPRVLRQLFKTSQQSHFPYTEKPPKVKIVISMREDFLGYLEDLTREIPGILRNRFRLLPLSREQAREAIEKPAQLSGDELVRSKGFSFAAEAVDEMLDFLCERRVSDKIVKTRDVEPFQLQLICQHIEEKIIKRLDKTPEGHNYCVQREDLGGKVGMRRIFQGFYEERLRVLSPTWKKRRVRKLCEKGLIESEGRVSLHKEYIKRKYKVPEPLLDVLVNNRLLLRSEPRMGNILYELTHDTMVQPILRSRRERKIRNLRIGIPILVFILVVVGIGISKQISKTSEISILYEKAEEFKSLGRDREAINKYRNILEISKKQAKSYLEIGRIYENNNKIKEAIKIYKESIENKVRDERIYFQLGEIYFKQEKNPEKAIEYYERAIEIDPKFSEAYRALGIVYEGEQRFEDAQEKYEKALEIDNKNGEAYKQLMVLYLRRDKYDEAIEVYRKAVKVSAAYKDIITYIERTIVSWQVSHKLETFYQKAAEMDFADALYYEKLGYDFNYFKKYDQAIENYERALRLDNTNASIYSSMAVLHIIQDEPDRALGVYRQAVEASADCAYIYKDIARELWKKRMTGEREELYRIAADVQSNDSTYFEELGDDFKDLRMYEEAIASYKKAFHCDDKNGDAYRKLADLHIQRKKPGEALEVYRQAVKACLDCADIYRDIARTLERRNMGKELRELYREASEVNAKEALYYEKLGDDFHNLREYEEAQKNYVRALEQDNKRAPTYRKLAILNISRDRPEDALRVYQDAVSASVDNAYIYKSIARAFKEKNMQREYEMLYRIAARVNLGQSDYYKGVGEGFAFLKNQEMAVKNFERALSIDDRDILLYTKLVLAYIDLGNIDKVIDVYYKAVNISVTYNYAILRTTALALKGKGMNGELERLYQAASEFESPEAVYYEKLGAAFTVLREYERAIKSYEKALQFDKKNVNTYKNLALLYIQEKQPGEAIRVYSDAVTVSEDYVYIVKDIASEMKKKGMKKELSNLYQAAYKFKTDNPTYYKELGYAFSKLKEYSRATSTFKKVVELAPGDHRAFEQQGVAFRKKGDYDSAINSYKESIRLNPKNASIYNKLAIAYGRKGDFQGAKESYKKAIELDPDYIKAKINLAELELVTGNFDAAINLAKQTLWIENIQPMEKLPVMFISITASLFKGKQAEALQEINQLIKYYKSIPPGDYGRWDYAHSKPFIEKSTGLRAKEKIFLLDLIKFLEFQKKAGVQELAEIERKIAQF